MHTQWSFYCKAPLPHPVMWLQFVCINYHLHYLSYLSHEAAPCYVAKNALLKKLQGLLYNIMFDVNIFYLKEMD